MSLEDAIVVLQKERSHVALMLSRQSGSERAQDYVEALNTVFSFCADVLHVIADEIK